MDAQRPGEFERLEVAPERHALPVFLQPVFVECLQPEEHVRDPELFPEPEHLLVAQQNVAAGLQVVALLDAGSGDRFAQLHAVPLVDERDIVDNEDARLADRAQILDDPLGADQPIAASVEGPGAAERAVPGAAARELDRGAGVEHREAILAADRRRTARRRPRTQRMRPTRRWALSACRYTAHGRPRVC